MESSFRKSKFTEAFLDVIKWHMKGYNCINYKIKFRLKFLDRVVIFGNQQGACPVH